MPKLIVISEEMSGRSFELVDDRVSVGRVPDNTICLDDNAISSHHAELSKRGDDYVVRDMNSTNGTRVNGQRVVETRLYHGDVVGFAHIQLQYYSEVKGVPQPMPELKKTVDLSSIPPGTTTRPVNFGSANPFAKDRKSSSKTVLQVVVIGLGLVAVGLLTFFILKVLNI